MNMEQQIAHEGNMYMIGSEGFKRKVAEAATSGRQADASYAVRIIRQLADPLADVISAYLTTVTPGKQAAAKVLLRRVDPHVSAIIALRTIFRKLEPSTQYPKLVAAVGQAIEDEARFTAFQEKHKEYYDKIIKEFERKRSTDTRYKRRVLVHSANDLGDGWQPWNKNEISMVGMALVEWVIEHSDLIYTRNETNNNRVSKIVEFTPEMSDWIHDHVDSLAELAAVTDPCIIQPQDWVGVRDGGYYTPQLRNLVPMIKMNKIGHAAYKDLTPEQMQLICEPLNRLQATPWTVNTKVHDVLRQCVAMKLNVGLPSREPLVPEPCPVQGIEKENMNEEQTELFNEWKSYARDVYTQERERRGKTYGIARILGMAKQYREHEKFWYVWSYDFRGRAYSATTGFSPQGPDIGKALLQFPTGTKLGSAGLRWFLIDGANRYGEDKISNDARIDWVQSNATSFLNAASDPIEHREVWASADKPFQFLAWLFEFKQLSDWIVLGRNPEQFETFLPVGRDGSCNGLQHFSAALRDAVGGAATNLTPSDLPSDIYTKVAERASSKLRLIDDAMLRVQWEWYFKEYGKNGVMPRSMAKRPVMTLPYGATDRSCLMYILEDMQGKPHKFEKAFAAAKAMQPILWGSISEVVIAARGAMDWLQKAAGVCGKVNAGLEWNLPDGFKVVQKIHKVNEKQYQITHEGKRFRVRIPEVTARVNTIKQRLGVAPNFVHSLDSYHMREVIRRLAVLGIDLLAFIHDDFGVPAGQIETLNRVIREAFVDMYQANNFLQMFKDTQEALNGVELPEIPPMGDLDIRDVLKSEYFFS